MKLSKLTKPELGKIFRNANFTEDLLHVLTTDTIHNRHKKKNGKKERRPELQFRAANRTNNIKIKR